MCFLYEKVTRCFGTACARGLCRRGYGCGIYLEPADSGDRAIGKYGQAVLPPRLYRILGRRAVFAPARPTYPPPSCRERPGGGKQVARDIAEFCGFSQGMSYSFESPKVFDKLRLPEDSQLRKTVDIMNPLGEDYSVMRTTSLNGMLTSLATNYNRRNKNVRLYELGNVYLPKSLPLTELPEERMQFTLGMYGDGDFFTMKGVVEEFFEKIGMHEKEKYDPDAGKTYLHPGRQANIIYDGKVVGYLGEIHPEVADAYGIGERAYVAVIDMPEILPYATFDRKYTGIAKYPAVTRDISMVVPKKILVGQIEEVIEKNGGAHLESYKLFDLYEGAQIKAGFKSVAYSIVFRAKDKTLEEAEITAAMNKILKGLEDLGIELRK